MADIAIVFHWSLESMDAMSLLELTEWHERAARRWPKDEE